MDAVNLARCHSCCLRSPRANSARIVMVPRRHSVLSLGLMNQAVKDCEGFRWRLAVLLPLTVVVLMAGSYVLILGPVLRYSGKPFTATVVAGTVKPPSRMVRGRTTPRWVATVYRPAFLPLDSQLTPSYGKHDPINVYRAYLQWWHDRP